MKKIFSMIVLFAILVSINACSKNDSGTSSNPVAPLTNKSEEPTQPPSDVNNPPTPTPAPTKLSLELFFKTIEGHWYGDNLSSYQKQGGHRVSLFEVKKESNGYTFQVFGTCRYVPSKNVEELQSDYTSDYNYEYLFVDEQTGEVSKVCRVKYDGTLETEHRGTMTADTLHVDITPCYEKTSWGYMDIAIVNGKVQMSSKTRNYDRNDVICSSEPEKR